MRKIVSCTKCGGRTLVTNKRVFFNIPVRYRRCKECGAKFVTKESKGTEVIMYKLKDHSMRAMLEEE